MNSAVQPHVGDTHAVSLAVCGIPGRINHKCTRIACKEQFSCLLIEIGPGIGGQRTVQAALGIQQLIADFILVAQQLVPVHHIDAGTGHHKQGIGFLDPDIVVVVVWEVVQLPDRSVRVQVAQPVAGHNKDTAGLRIQYGPENDLRAEPVRTGQHPLSLSVLQHRNSVSVRSRQHDSVVQFCQRQDHRMDHPARIQDPVCDLVVPDVNNSGVPSCQDRSVRQLDHHTRPVSESGCDSGILVLGSVRLHLKQTVVIGADPEMVIAVCHHAADPGTFHLLCQLIRDPLPAGEIHRIQPFVRTEVIYILPFGNRVHNAVVHTDCAVNVPEIGRSHPQQAEPGGRKPHIPLVIRQYLVDGIVEVIRIDPFKRAVRADDSDTVVRGNHQLAGIHPVDILDAFQRAG